MKRCTYFKGRGKEAIGNYQGAITNASCKNGTEKAISRHNWMK